MEVEFSDKPKLEPLTLTCIQGPLALHTLVLGITILVWVAELLSYYQCRRPEATGTSRRAAEGHEGENFNSSPQGPKIFPKLIPIKLSFELPIYRYIGHFPWSNTASGTYFYTKFTRFPTSPIELPEIHSKSVI